MPYIKQGRREELQNGSGVQTPGELNYALTFLIHDYMKRHGPLNYNLINEVMGVIESMKLELYRQVASPYEDEKKQANGSISHLDFTWMEQDE